MYGNSYEKNEQGGWPSQAPQQPQYGGYQPGPYAQQPYQQPSYGAPGQAPYYGAPGAPPPQAPFNNYGPPPQQNYGATGQFGGYNGSPPPPPNAYPSYGQPANQGHYQQPPPQQQQYQQPPPQQQQQSAGQAVTFRFSHSGGKDGILNSTVTDNWNRPVFSLQSTKKETTVLDQEKRPLAIFDWSHSSPTMDYSGRRLKVKEWMPIDKSHKVRSVNHQGVTYDWVETGPGAITLTAKGSHQPIATYYNANNQPTVEIQPEGLRNGIVEVAVLGVFLMCSGKPFGDIKESSSSLPIILGGFLGTMI